LAYTGEAPLARSDDLIVEELHDEILIYDTDADRAHSLSPEAAKVWRACNGKTPVEQLSSRLGLDQETVDRALAELDSCELLEVKPSVVADGSTRREVTLKLAKVGAAATAAPLILSVVAPTPAMAVTLAQCLQAGIQAGNDCGGGGDGCKSIGCCCCPNCIAPAQDPTPGSTCISGQTKCCVDTCSNCGSATTRATLGFRCETNGCNCGNV
jgi:DNA-binding MarR family transcriptional regulator